MGANQIDFVTQLIYGDLGVSELGTPAPAGAVIHFNWTLDRLPSGPTGTQFLAHHLDYMLSRYAEWRGKYFLPPVAPWDGSNVFPSHDPAELPVSPPDPQNLRSVFPPGARQVRFPPRSPAWTASGQGSGTTTTVFGTS